MAVRDAGYRVPAWALPGELAAIGSDRPVRRRTVRDWVVDTLLFGFAVWWWQAATRSLVQQADPDYLALIPGWMHTVDPWLGAAACLALWWRRRFPLAVAIMMVPTLAVAGTSTGAVLVALFTLAVHRGWLAATLVTLVQVAQVVSFALLWQPREMPGFAFAVFTASLFLAPLAFGMAVRFRRQLVFNLRRDAERERQEHARRLVEARRVERQRIAREMHDVLAHRISLVSVHAGALAYRTAQAGERAGAALTTAEVIEAVRVIRDNAHQALTELGEVLSVLRTDAEEPAELDAPPPLLTDLPRLINEARDAGQRVVADLDGLAEHQPPLRQQEQRTVYRVVQEGLTNARKHAPHAPVVVRVSGSPEAGVEVTVTNPASEREPTGAIPGAGTGLVGLAERVMLDGGQLEHGWDGETFRLTARLPWRE